MLHKSGVQHPLKKSPASRMMGLEAGLMGSKSRDEVKAEWDRLAGKPRLSLYFRLEFGFFSLGGACTSHVSLSVLLTLSSLWTHDVVVKEFRNHGEAFPYHPAAVSSSCRTGGFSLHTGKED